MEGVWITKDSLYHYQLFVKDVSYIIVHVHVYVTCTCMCNNNYVIPCYLALFAIIILIIK